MKVANQDLETVSTVALVYECLINEMKLFVSLRSKCPPMSATYVCIRGLQKNILATLLALSCTRHNGICMTA